MTIPSHQKKSPVEQVGLRQESEKGQGAESINKRVSQQASLSFGPALATPGDISSLCFLFLKSRAQQARSTIEHGKETSPTDNGPNKAVLHTCPPCLHSPRVWDQLRCGVHSFEARARFFNQTKIAVLWSHHPPSDPQCAVTVKMLSLWPLPTAWIPGHIWAVGFDSSH